MSFVIVANQRTGTMLLTTMLESHPDLHVYGEINVHGGRAAWPERAARIAMLGQYEGVNLKYNQIGGPFGDVQVLHLLREDLRALAVSVVINSEKSIYHRPAHLLTPELRSVSHIWASDMSTFEREMAKSATLAHADVSDGVSLPADKVAKTMRRIAQRVIAWDKRLPGALKIVYEDLTGGRETMVMPEASVARICAYLGVPPAPLTTRLRKTNPPDYEQWVTNWEEIKALEIPEQQAYAEVVRG